MNDVCAAALFADSGPATPSIAPWPKGFRLLRDTLLKECRTRTTRGRGRPREGPPAPSQRSSAQDRRGRCGANPRFVRSRFRHGLDDDVPPALVLEVPKDLGDPEHADRHRHEVDTTEYSSRFPRVKRGVRRVQILADVPKRIPRRIIASATTVEPRASAVDAISPSTTSEKNSAEPKRVRRSRGRARRERGPACHCASEERPDGGGREGGYGATIWAISWPSMAVTADEVSPAG